ncbi:MAG TPA: MATE family efflux transporter [Candidatus Tidjanibacter faecipullorum]|uniref:Multidrug export protein MepA n=1 Tax=Candidatus Tidjanibacter faecipullorum TaxID=2838766 RepID=A0A9D2IMG6_9BACT|nr:MATE family efflux transporter [Candidatus Tidjanibacter faecipullorum]
MALTSNNPELLGTEPVGKLLKRYALPAIIAMSSSSLYNIIDSIFIGHGVGPMAMSGLAIAMPLMNLLTAFGALIGVGASSLTSIRLGQGNKQRAFLILSNAVMLNVVIGLTLTIIGLVFLDPILYSFGASDATIPYARDFMRIILAGNVVTHVFLGLNEILRASGYPKKAMTFMLITVLIVVCLNPLFIFGFRWGVKGSAFATLIGQCVALGLELTHFLNKKHFLYLKRGTFRFMSTIVRKVISIGLAPFLLNICASIVVIFINNALKRTGGDISIGAYGIVNRVLMLFVMIVNGFNQGMQPIVGFNFGARQFGRVTAVYRLTVFCAVCVTTFGFLLGHFFPHWVAGIFTTDETLLNVAELGLKTALLAFPIVGFQIISSGFFQYIGKPQKAILLSLTRQLLFLLPLLAILPGIYGAKGVWISLPIADVLSAILAAVLIFFQLRKMKLHPDQVSVI